MFDTNVVVRSRKSKKNRQWATEKGKTLVYKTLHRKLNIEKHEPKKNMGEVGCSGTSL